jgi:hypothetical protein
MLFFSFTLELEICEFNQINLSVQAEESPDFPFHMFVIILRRFHTE